MTPGKLYLIPTPLAAAPLQSILPAQVIAQAAKLEHWIVENAKPARAFIKQLSELAPLARPLQELHITELNKHGPNDIAALLAPARGGADMALVSDAGAPAVADPGALVVAAAHASGIEVLPCVGPSSILLALMASGLNGQCFRFIGYLPKAGSAEAIRQAEARSKFANETQLCIETPYRNTRLFGELCATLKGSTRLVVAANLSSGTPYIGHKTVSSWKQAEPPHLDGQPCIFLWLA